MAADDGGPRETDGLEPGPAYPLPPRQRSTLLAALLSPFDPLLFERVAAHGCSASSTFLSSTCPPRRGALAISCSRSSSESISSHESTSPRSGRPPCSSSMALTPRRRRSLGRSHPLSVPRCGRSPTGSDWSVSRYTTAATSHLHCGDVSSRGPHDDRGVLPARRWLARACSQAILTRRPGEAV